MNISIELSPAIEQQLRDVAAQYQLDLSEFAPQAVQGLLAHSVNWKLENQPNVEAMLDELASRISAQREQARSAQREKNQAAIALLRSWREEDAGVNSEEKARREVEGKALEAGLAAHPFLLEG